MRGLHRQKIVRAARALVVTVAAAGLLAGCTDESPSRPEFIARANDLCREVERDLDSVDEQFSSAGSLDEVDEAVDRATRAYEDFHREVNQLEMPEKDRATLDRWLDAIDRTVEALHRLDDAVDAGDARRVRAIAREGAELEEEAGRIADIYGLDECAARASAAAVRPGADGKIVRRLEHLGDGAV